MTNIEKDPKADYYSETTNTFAGIPTPPDQQDIAPTDSINDTVEAIMDNLSGADKDGTD